MWILSLFDLPVKTKRQRRNSTRFRNALLKEGFVRIQLSVYARYCLDAEVAASVRNQVKQLLPPSGEVRFLDVTSTQFARQEILYGKRKKKPECQPEQLLLF